ncbi:MAG: MBL fold metallo-hydrolase [Promethearchaeota archaeon]
MVTIRTLGACNEVGRSGFLVSESENQVLLDYGLSMKENSRLPIDVVPRDLDAVILSHAHVDHSGALPYLYISSKVPCFMTKASKELVKVLLNDTLRISGPNLPYEDIEIRKLIKFIQLLSFGDREVSFKSNAFSFKLLDAGHIPGSAMVILKMGGKNILYTGDINTRDTRLLWGANNKDIPKLDAVIVESTYASVTHPPRLTVEQEFIAAVKNVLGMKGKVLIPAFGVARSQEIIAILQSYGISQKYKIVVDGMAREISRVLLKDPNSLRTPYSLDRLNLIKRQKSTMERRAALRNADIIIAPSGMLKGGTVRYYAPNIIDNEKNGVFLVSYQVEGTPGRVLLEEGIYEDFDYSEMNESDDLPNKRTITARSIVEKYDFSSHSDGNDLLAFLNSLQYNNDGKEVPILCVHGDRNNCSYLAKKVNEQLKGVQAIAPEIDETFSI